MKFLKAINWITKLNCHPKKNLITVFLMVIAFTAFNVQTVSAQCAEPQCEADFVNGNGPSPCNAKLYCSNSSSTTNGIIACTQAADTDGCGVTTTIPITSFTDSGFLPLFTNQVPANESSCYIDPDDGQPYDFVQWIKFATPEFINSVKLQGVGQMEAWTVFYAGTSSPGDVINPIANETECDNLVNSLSYVEGACSDQNQWKTWINEDAVVQAGLVNVYYIALFYNQSSVENGGDINFKTKDCENVDVCTPEVVCPQTVLTFCEGSGDDSENGVIDNWLNGFENTDCGNNLVWTLTGEGLNTAFDGLASTIANLSAGLYTLTNALVDGNGITIASCSANILIHDLTDDDNRNEIVCPGDSYTWTIDGEDYEVFAADGTVVVVSQDENGCDYNINLSVTEHEQTGDDNRNEIVCPGDSYTWTIDGEDYEVFAADGTVVVVSQDENGCDYNINLSVTEHEQTGDDNRNEIVCPGYSYTWTIDGEDYEVFAADGTVVVVSQDENGCDYNINLSVTEHEQTGDDNRNEIVCPGYSYTWTIDGEDYEVFAADGTVVVVSQDENGCDYNINLSVTEHEQTGDDNRNEIVCPGYSYTWTIDGEDYEVFAADGTVVVVSQDENGCDYNINLSVTEHEQTGDDNRNEIVCPGYSYTWTIDGEDYEVFAADGTVVVVSQDENGCDYNINLSVTEHEQTGDDNRNEIVCPGYSYTWTIDGEDYEVFAADGTVVVVSQDENGCDYNINLSVTEHEQTGDDNRNETVCLGDSYTWTIDGEDYEVFAADGTVVVVSQDENGCDYNINLNVDEWPLPIVEIDDQMICQDVNTFDLTALEPVGQEGGSWTSDSCIVLDPLAASILCSPFTYTYTDANGCVGSDIVNYTFGGTNESPNTSSGEICIGDETLNICDYASAPEGEIVWVGYTFNGGPLLPVVLVDGCPETPTVGGTYAYFVELMTEDGCVTTSDAVSVITIIESPIIINCPSNADEASCQSQDAIDIAFDTWIAQFTYEGGTNSMETDLGLFSAPSACGGNVTIDYVVTDDCDQRETCSSTFTVADAPVLSVSCPSDANEASCQSQDAINDAFSLWIGQFSYNGGCGTVATDLSGYTAPLACGGSVTINYSATDVCNQSQNCSSTFTVIADEENPVITTNNQDGDLGCNPDVIPPVFKVNDNCLESEMDLDSSTDGPEQIDDCHYTQTWTANYTDACNNPALPVSITFTWTMDNTLPIITSNSSNQDLGCNPEIIPPLFKAEDDCMNVDMIIDGETDGPTNDGCNYSQTWTGNYTDACNNIGIPLSITYTWIVDEELPIITTNNQDTDLGCNPEVIPPEFKVNDNCLESEMDLDSSTDGPEQIDDCHYSQTWTANYTDACDNDALPVSVTYTWTVDNEAPKIELPLVELMCNEEFPEELIANWLDNCSEGGVISAGPTNIVNVGCAEYADYVFEVEDDCGNPATMLLKVQREFDLYEECETAFARDPNTNHCFIPDFNRWGWTNYYPSENKQGNPYMLDLYAGAAHCDISNRTPVGSVTIDYYGGYVTVTYNLDAGYVMNEAHVYIGCEKYPTVKKGNPTVAPGQYNFNPSIDLDHVSTYTVGPVAASGPIYVIAHAVTCEEICRCSVSEDDNGVFTPSSGNALCGKSSENTYESGNPMIMSMFKVNQEDNSNELDVNFEFDFDTNVRIEILDMNGIVIKEDTYNNYVKGSKHKMYFNMNNVSNNLLFVRIISDRGVAIKKIIMTKH